MPEATTVESTEQDVKPEQPQLTPEEQQKAAEADFAKGFAKGRGEEPPAEAKDESTTPAAPEQKTPEQPSAAPAAAPAKPAAPVDPWKDVPVVVRDQIGRLETLNRNLAGQIGNLNSQLKSVLTAAKAAAVEKGGPGAAPSEKQIAQAFGNPETWKQLKEDYPDWGGPVDERLTAFEAHIRAEIAKASATGGDTTALKAEIARLNQAQQQADQRFEQRLEHFQKVSEVNQKHPGWQETVNTNEFKQWSLEGGPTLEAYAQYKALDKSDPAKGEFVVNTWARQFPQWWADRGVYLFDPTVQGATKLLDGYANKGAPAPEQQKRQSDNQTRLERAVPARSVRGEPPSSALSDEAAFERGFKRARGKT